MRASLGKGQVMSQHQYLLNNGRNLELAPSEHRPRPHLQVSVIEPSVLVQFVRNNVQLQAHGEVFTDLLYGFISYYLIQWPNEAHVPSRIWL